MSMVAPQGRQHLWADALFRLLHEHCATIADEDVHEGEMPWADALLSAFALFARHAPSLLGFDKQQADGHVTTISGMERAPCDPRMRERLAPVAPESLRPSCTLVLRQRQRGQARALLGLRDGHDGVALAGTGSCSSKTIHGDSCLPKAHRHGSLTSAPQRLGAALLHPDCRAVRPRRPAPMGKQDGTEHHAGAHHAA
jgi:hypothetical protein